MAKLKLPPETPPSDGRSFLTTLSENFRSSLCTKNLSSNETLFRTGDRPTRIFFVDRGEIRLIRVAREGGVLVMQRITKGFLAEASLDADAYHCDAVAAGPTQVTSIPIGIFRNALHDAEVSMTWTRLLATEVIRLRSVAERLTLKSAAERILHYIEFDGKDGRLLLVQTQKAWAGELGLSHEALYRTLKVLRSNGKIDISRISEGYIISLRR